VTTICTVEVKIQMIYIAMCMICSPVASVDTAPDQRFSVRLIDCRAALKCRRQNNQQLAPGMHRIYNQLSFLCEVMAPLDFWLDLHTSEIYAV